MREGDLCGRSPSFPRVLDCGPDLRAEVALLRSENERLRRFVEQCAEPSPHWRHSEIRAAARAALSGRGSE